MSSLLMLGIDVGGTKLAGVAVAGAMVVAERRQALNESDLGSQVVDLARALVIDVGEGAPAGIGIAVPGQVDTSKGTIQLAVNLEADGLPIASIVSAQLGAPCFVEHDARAVVGWLAADRDLSDLAFLSVGTGVSAGVVLNGRVLRGTDGLAGEIGHLVADPNGPPCACGLAGCVEAFASGPSVALAAAEAIARGGRSGLGGRPTTEEVYQAAARGDRIAVDVVAGAADHLASAIRGIALSYGVPRVVVGGGVTRAGKAFVDPLLAAVQRERGRSPLVARALGVDAVEVLDDGRAHGALGAAAVARSQVRESVDRLSETRGEVGQH